MELFAIIVSFLKLLTNFTKRSLNGDLNVNSTFIAAIRNGYLNL